MPKLVHIALICDDNYVLPTAVAIQSICNCFDPERSYCFHVICADLQPENEQIFQRFAKDNVQMDVRRVSVERFEQYRSAHARVAQKLSALYKIFLPDIITEADKLLYLDGDILVRGDLSRLYDTDIEGCYAAVVEENATMYFRREGTMTEIQRYFNSGVMLLNLELLRKEKVPAKIMDTFIRMNDGYFMDQDPFNIVFENHVRFLPMRYNLSAVSLFRLRANNWTLEMANKRYDTQYQTPRELFEDAQIVHFACPEKPWKTDVIPYAAAWGRVYRQTPLDEHPLYPAAKSEEDACLLSLVVSCNSFADAVQSTKNLNGDHAELVCRCPAAVQAEIRKSLPQITVCADDEKLLDSLHGKYVLFLSAKEVPDESALEKLIREAEDCRLDIVCGEAGNRIRKNVYPLIDSGMTLLRRLMRNQELYETEECALYRREFLTANGLSPFTGEIFPYRAMLAAERATVLTEVLLPAVSDRVYRGQAAQQAMLQAAQPLEKEEKELYRFLLKKAGKMTPKDPSMKKSPAMKKEVKELQRSGFKEQVKKTLQKCHLGFVVKAFQKKK